MKYSLIKLLSLLILISLITCGCMGSGGDNTSSGETTGEGTKVPEETASEDIEIPAAKEIDPALKTEVDELIEKIIAGKDSEQAEEKLREICLEKNTDIALFAYLLERPEPQIAYIGLDSILDYSEEEKREEIFNILTYTLKHPGDQIKCDTFTVMRIYTDTDEEKEKTKELAKEALKDSCGPVRAEGVLMLGWLKDKTSLELFKEMLEKEESPEVIAALIETMDSMGEDNTEKLLELSDSGQPYVKCCAVKILSQKKNKDLLPVLIKMLDDESATSLEYEFSEGEPLIYHADDPTLQKTAITGLEEITGEKFEGSDENDTAGVVNKCKEWYEKNK